jgi:hypothetical protein
VLKPTGLIVARHRATPEGSWHVHLKVTNCRVYGPFGLITTIIGGVLSRLTLRVAAANAAFPAAPSASGTAAAIMNVTKATGNMYRNAALMSIPPFGGLGTQRVV